MLKDEPTFKGTKGTKSVTLGSKALKPLKSARAGRPDHMAQSVILPPKSTEGHDTMTDSPPALTPRDAPVMSRMLEAKAQLDAEEGEEQEAAVSPKTTDRGREGRPAVGLKIRLKEIFGLETAEEVIAGTSSSVNGVFWVELTFYRIPMLAAPERAATGIYVHHGGPCLLLRLSPKEVNRCVEERVSIEEGEADA